MRSTFIQRVVINYKYYSKKAPYYNNKKTSTIIIANTSKKDRIKTTYLNII